MKRNSQIPIVTGLFLLVIALCVQGTVVVDLWGRTEQVLGEIRAGEKFRSPQIQVQKGSYVQLQVELGMFVRSASARKRGYKVPFEYSFRNGNGRELFSDKQVLESSYVDSREKQGEHAPNAHFMKPFKIKKSTTLEVVCHGSPSKTDQVSLETIRLTLLHDSPPFWNRLIIGFILFPIGFYMAVGGWVWHILKKRGQDKESNPQREDSKRMCGRTAGLHWAMAVLTFWIYGFIWLFLLAKDINRLKGKRCIGIGVNATILSSLLGLFCLLLANLDYIQGDPMLTTMYFLSLLAVPGFLGIIVVRMAMALRTEEGVWLPSIPVVFGLSVFWMMSLPLIQWNVNKLMAEREKQNNDEM